ncbi:MAG TPA: M50 family metallopeptidase [Fimbriimonas sp.]
MVVLEYLWIAIVFVTMISILVAAHELGHYLFARLFNMGCEEFAIGFGKPTLATWMRRRYKIPLKPGQDPMISQVSEGSALEGGDKPVERRLVDDGTAIEEVTDFTVRPWPIGGFVRIKGMMPEEDQSETRIPGGFYSKPPWQRLIVLFAGPMFSVLAGILVLVPLYIYKGIDKPVDRPVLGELAKEGPAVRAGLQKGDRILTIQGQPISTFYEVLSIVRESPEVPLRFEYDRQGERRTTVVTPVKDPHPTMIIGPGLVPTPDTKIQAKIGAGWQVETVQLPFRVAVGEAFQQPVMAVKSLVAVFAKPARFETQMGGPATMVAATGALAKQGVDKVLWLAAMLSISIGIMNLLPVPPLDGGQMVVAFAEMLRGGRRLSIKSQSLANVVGGLFVIALMLGAVSVDIKRFIEAPGKEAAMKRQLEGKGGK